MHVVHNLYLSVIFVSFVQIYTMFLVLLDLMECNNFSHIIAFVTWLHWLKCAQPLRNCAFLKYFLFNFDPIFVGENVKRGVNVVK